MVTDEVLCFSQTNNGPSTSKSTSTTTSTSNTKYYNYFAFGSNMASATMTALRQLDPIASSAAILPDHRLAFNVPGTAFIEPSWASVEPVPVPVQQEEIQPKKKNSNNSNESIVVHGVLYKLTQEDFESVCQTEGVPFGYRLHRCQVIPYKGNDKDAGQIALTSSSPSSKSVPAFTLRAGRKIWRESRVDIPPSRAYRNVLVRGAKEFRIDRDYVNDLENIPVGRTLIGDGIAENMLKAAELQQQQRSDR